jgi:CSLREA domain-containing protein
MCLAAPASATTISVTTEDDRVLNDGVCSLREAIAAANTDTASGAAGGECPAGAGPDVVVLGPGSFGLTLTGAGEDANATGDLDVTTGTVTISGAGSASTLDGRGIDRVLHVLAGATATIERVTITGGRAPDGAPGATAADGGAGLAGSAGGESLGGTGGLGGDGGGVLNDGTLTVSAAVVTANQSGRGGPGGATGNGGPGGDNAAGEGGSGGRTLGGRGGPGGNGGGIASSGPLVVVDTGVSSNVAGDGGAGGAAANGGAGGSATGVESPGGAGGASVGGTGGSGGFGGGIWAQGRLTVVRSTLSANRSGDGGAGGSAGRGGAGASSIGSWDGGAGGDAFGGAGGFGGPGGAVAQAAPTEAIQISQSTLSGNATGDAGAPGSSVGGGDGGTGGNTTGSGGPGGNATGGGSASSRGGDGGAVHMSRGTIESATITGNRTGSGRRGADATSGGAGGADSGGSGGPGQSGRSVGGHGLAGGRGGGVAVFNPGAQVVLTNVTVTGNTTGAGAPGGGGGTGPSTNTGGVGGDGGSGGGVFGLVAGTSLLHATVTQNATGAGGAGGGPGTLTGTAGAPGTDGTGAGVQAPASIGASIVGGCAGAVTDLGSNVSFPDPTCPGINGNPLLGPLAANFGPTSTHALAPGSAAVDVVPAAGCPPTDQRGIGRPQGAACDAGAYELAPPSASTGGAAGVTQTVAGVAGGVNPNGRPTLAHFEFGTTTAYGRTTPDQAIAPGADVVVISATLPGLAPGTTVHYRVVAGSADGTGVGDDRTFTTLPVPPVPRPAFAGVSFLTKTAKLTSKGEAPVALRCPANTPARCTGTLKLTAKVKAKRRKSRTVTLGSAKFALLAGKRGTVKVKLSKAGRALVKGKGLKTTGTAAAKDGLGRAKTTSGKLTLKPAAKKKKRKR